MNDDTEKSDDKPSASSNPDRIIEGAKDFFAEVEGFENRWREKWREELDFRALQQWPDAAIAARTQADGPKRPCMVIDQTDQYMRQVTNDARMSPPGLRATPIDDKADLRVAEDLQGLFRHIERVSRANRAYLTALDWSCTIGRGAFRIDSVLVNKALNHWEPRVGRIANALDVYFDPYSVEVDGSDQTDAMIIKTYSPATFRRRWPTSETAGSWDNGRYSGWCLRDEIRVAEWHSVRERSDKVLVTETGDEVTEEALREMLTVNPMLGYREESRSVPVCSVRFVTEHDVLDETEFPAPHIGLIPVYGDDRYTTEGRELFGMVRRAADAGRLSNYLVSNFAEAINSQTRAQWVGPAEAFKGYEKKWALSNSSGEAYLPFNTTDPDNPDKPLQPPVRNAVDLQIMGYVGAIQTTATLIQGALGMYQASVGSRSNETSGVAIARRKSESDVGTYHYIDNLSESIAYGGRIIMAMLPRVFDTPRVMRILGEDDKPDHVRIDPDASVPFQQEQGGDGKGMHVLNPSIGTYDIHVEVGPSFASKREETASTLAELYGRNPQLMQATGDIYFENQNFPGAEKIAKRLRSLLPPPVKAADEMEDVPPEVSSALQAAADAIEQREQVISQAMQELNKRTSEAQRAIGESRVEAANVDAARARMQAERARLDKEAADLAHQQELLRREHSAMQAEGRRLMDGISNAGQAMSAPPQSTDSFEGNPIG